MPQWNETYHSVLAGRPRCIPPLILNLLKDECPVVERNLPFRISRAAPVYPPLILNLLKDEYPAME